MKVLITQLMHTWGTMKYYRKKGKRLKVWVSYSAALLDLVGIFSIVLKDIPAGQTDTGELA